MKQLKSVELFSDVICENCTSYNHSSCCKSLPAIPTESGNKCGDGGWMLKGKSVNYRGCCLFLLPFSFVTDVEDLICQNCDYYDSSRGECHYYRENIFKTSPGDWCNNGVWLEDDSNCGSVYHLYERLIAGKATEKSNSTKRLVKSVEVFSDAICENCISYNQRRCCYTLPFVPVGPDYKCNKGQWLHKGKMFNLHGISTTLVSHRLVKDIKNLRCGECIFYNPTKEECHYHRQNVFKSGPDNWCGTGEWLYEEKEFGVRRGSTYLYSKFMEGKNTQEK
jgi:hypothetical protein